MQLSSPTSISSVYPPCSSTPRPGQPPVEWLQLFRDRLITVGGGVVVMFHAWSDGPNTASEFFK